MFDNNKKVKKVKMAKVYTELKNMDACDDNYQVRPILIKFSYLKENFGGLFRGCQGYDLTSFLEHILKICLNFLKEEGQKQQNVKSNTLFTVECHLREGNGHRKGIQGVCLVYCEHFRE